MRCQQGEPYGGGGARALPVELLFFKLHITASPYFQASTTSNPPLGWEEGRPIAQGKGGPDNKLRESAAGTPAVGRPGECQEKQCSLMPGTKRSTR